MPRTSWSKTSSHLSHLTDTKTCRVLADMLAPHRKSKMTNIQSRPSAETPADESSPIIVLPSSTDLFYFYGQSLEQCAKLSTGQALYDLSSLHKKWLRIYAGGCYVLRFFLKADISIFVTEEVLAVQFKRYVHRHIIM